MKKILVLLAILIIPSVCSAARIPLGTFFDKSYELNTDSLRFCSTTACLYINDKPEQSFVAAEIIVFSKNQTRSPGSDVLSYSKDKAFEIKSILINAAAKQFVLLYTMTYDSNGNLIGMQDETVEIKSITADGYSVNQGVAQSQEKTVYSRRIAWSDIQPGSPGEVIVNSILSYSSQNYDEIDQKSKSRNFISAK